MTVILVALKNLNERKMFLNYVEGEIRFLNGGLFT